MSSPRICRFYNKRLKKTAVYRPLKEPISLRLQFSSLTLQVNNKMHIRLEHYLICFIIFAEVLNQYSKQYSEENEYIYQNQSMQCNRHAINRSFTIQESRSSSSSLNEEHHRHGIIMISNGPRSDSSRDSGLDYRDSGTSSPQPNESGSKLNLMNGSSGSSLISSTNTKTTDEDFNDNDSDSNDSVFSTIRYLISLTTY